MAVRRAQEAVELTLKGFLKVLGIEYPKVHDVGEIFVLQVSEKLNVEKESLQRIKDISARLGREREPSFYFERLYTADDARVALDDAKFVFNFINELFRSLKPE